MTASSPKEYTNPISPHDMSPWFDELISTLSVHQVQIETNTASKEVKNFYANLFQPDLHKLYEQQRNLFQKYYVSQILVAFYKATHEMNFQKIAFHFSDTKVLGWVQIENDNEELEKAVILAEAKVNAEFNQYGFYLDVMIVEERDNIPVPASYKEYEK